MIASVSASAPAAGLRDLEVMCIRILASFLAIDDRRLAAVKLSGASRALTETVRDISRHTQGPVRFRRPYPTVWPASNCALELPNTVLGAFIRLCFALACEPQPVNPKTADATASAPTASLREVDVLCIFFFLSSCYCRVFEQSAALAADNGLLCGLAGTFRGTVNWGGLFRD